MPDDTVPFRQADDGSPHREHGTAPHASGHDATTAAHNAAMLCAQATHGHANHAASGDAAPIPPTAKHEHGSVGSGEASNEVPQPNKAACANAPDINGVPDVANAMPAENHATPAFGGTRADFGCADGGRGTWAAQLLKVSAAIQLLRGIVCDRMLDIHLLNLAGLVQSYDLHPDGVIRVVPTMVPL